ncbi:hypothetical protein [Streptomyces sp. Ag109_O5-10]|uniref:hypothetical protein n=1 Tax=Streptomyces sp. Ag109_O5-10 TaxID=1855349 RepID=UPI00115FC4B1|nr:hypothetical protein [Streptomyces sp. Ag109_O5-10]
MAGKPRTSGKNKKTRAARHPATPAQAAEECERLVEQFPEDREELLREAADAWRSAGVVHDGRHARPRRRRRGDGGRGRRLSGLLRP